jgi:peptide/nickel transport system substrate-binding protein
LRKKWVVILLTSLALLMGSACTDDSDEPAGAAVTEGLTEESLVPTVVLVGPGSDYDAQQYESNQLVLDSMEELGISSEYKFAADFADIAGLVEAEDEHMVSFGYLGTLLRTDPDALLGPPFLCEFAVPGGSNYAQYCNDEFDELIYESRQTYDFEARRDLLLQAQEYIAKDIPLVTSYYPTQFDVYNSEAYDNVVPAVAVGLYNFWNFYEATPIGEDKTFRLAHGGGIDNMNIMAQEEYTAELELNQDLNYDTLVRISPEAQVMPWAAESFEAVDETTIVAKLNDGMTFHDGRPVTAEDVKFSYDYIKEWEVGFFLSSLSALDSVEVVDELTVQFNLTSPSAVFPHVAMSQVPILPKHVWQNVVKDNNLNHPAEWEDVDFTGSGPYVLENVNLAEGVEYSRYDDYWAGPAGSEAFVMKNLADSQAILRDLQDEAVYFHQTDTLLSNAVDQAREDDRFTVLETPGLTVRFTAFVMGEGSPFADYHLRHAASHLWDYDTILEVITGGDSDPGTGTIAPGNETWHNSDIPREEVEGPHWPSLNLALARTILEDAGYRWDEEGRLHYPEDYEPQLLCEC